MQTRAQTARMVRMARLPAQERPECSTFAIILQEQENKWLHRLAEIAKSHEFEDATAFVFDELMLPPGEGPLTPRASIAAAEFLAETGVQVSWGRATDFTQLPPGILSSHLYAAYLRGVGDVPGRQIVHLPGNRTCLLFVIAHSLGWSTEQASARFRSVGQEGPLQYKTIADSPDCKVAFALATSGWGTRPGLYIYHEPPLFSDVTYRHASGIIVHDDLSFTFLDDAFKTAFHFEADALTRVLLPITQKPGTSSST